MPEKEMIHDPSAKTKHFTKGEIIQSRGLISHNVFYVKKGLVRSYLIDSNGKEHIFMFASEGWLIADIESIEFHQPAQLFIDCIEDSEVLVIHRENQHLDFSNGEAVKEKLTQLYRRIGKLQRRIIMQMSTPAVDRYGYFLQTYPDLPNRVPQYMIASYLGITPQALSTIRKVLSQKKEG
mgnify:FL=1|tara:strand:+ start:20677 stop:21216 length:540 start_codon:yes stop_codon:yes gene_type:complete